MQSLKGSWDVGSIINVPADLRGQVINIVRGPEFSSRSAEQAIAVPLINGRSEQKLAGGNDPWISLQYSFSEGSTIIKVVGGHYANFTQIFYRI
ncbi:hypothetical protein ID850_12725 [Xenorhabdus sp. Flor]|nr:hypothetical protein [Xenorhabdus sp. Flor]